MIIRHRRDLWKVVTVEGDSCEIGIAEGFFSAEILAMPCNFPKHYCVDRWACMPDIKGDSAQPQSWHDKNLEAARKRMEKFGDRAVFLRGESKQMAIHVPDNSLALLYIDGDHSYQGVRDDIWTWAMKVKPGGIVAFHDFLNEAYGVKRAVEEYCKKFGFTIELLPEDKVEDAGCYFRI